MTEKSGVNERDVALFEAGIKLGALYHQFVGTPVSLETIDGLERIIEDSIGVQPYVRSVSVSIDREMVGKKLNGRFGYGELEGRMLNVSLEVLYGNTKVNVGLAYDAGNDYPMMSIKKIESMV
ncbi:MAG: dihydroneopterin aldolase family protein [Candidatus Methanoperedens sp.]|jgi:hypothetical protein|nr:dihydroneopterin aldolase family protein [Candidatus Methanoperedens sp.]PKL54514.1 MAG: hypothetical protein CVV36_01530 [Candidatus Methanoperedenaceae archaeon HGW-Methanoperedenaceae-1]